MSINRNELIQSAKSKFYWAARFSKPKTKKTSDMGQTSTESAPVFIVSPAVSLALAQMEPESEYQTAPETNDVWPNVKEYYDVLHTIGVGTFAIVYSAFCKPRQDKCAVKCVDLRKWTSSLEQLMKDVQAMTQFNHDNLVTYFTAFVDKDELWLVLRYMENGSLRDVIKRKMRAINCKHGVFDEPTIATILTGVASGLDYLHSNGYIHRDIKTENILLGGDGSVVIADFAMTNCLAKTRSYVGSPHWLAPEIIEDPKHTYSFKADIWSFGVTAIEIVTGAPPYHKCPTMKVLMMTLLGESPSFETGTDQSDQYNQYGKTFRSLVNNCVQKDPLNRPTATELLFHPFFKKSQDKNLLQQVLATIPPDNETPQQKRTTKQAEPSNKASRKEWILATKSDDLVSIEKATEEIESGTKEAGPSTADETITTPSRGSVGRIKINHVHHITLRIRGLHLDTPMILKTAIHKERELFDIGFSYSEERDTPELIASELVREGLIDSRDRLPVVTNLKKLENDWKLRTVTFPLNSDIPSTETPCEWRLVGYASLIVVSTDILTPVTSNSTNRFSKTSKNQLSVTMTS